ncbi:MAG: NAD(P)-dependent methylenetetrahydromethanopterin dehydrogenase [Methylophilaceae bacterium]|uniref:NAD(P)-dependent methylenetetrahydromethanopterin dehydrogenase n=1 Tax=Methylovorus sp. MM2 TaxID=1848038 RepID=UPI0007DF69E0|nr:NAD(P)-dependent methylenetetrahydromethanopterin dehydrogenase [Methylovorus sp. MM2]OAM52879.1 methylenetetrahydromethanopterin dehydrogenase [Methylovorus sp. MM2]
MEKVSILHLITSAKNASPFDVNMAFDAGFDKIMPYTNVETKEVTGLVQDAIFSRSPSGVKREHVFIGGRDIDVAMDMLDIAKKSMVPPFQVSVFADPSGAFTTAAGMMAKVEQHLAKNFGGDLSGRKVSVFGATGPVGGCTAVIAAKYGATVELVAHRSVADVQAKAEAFNARYNINIGYTDGSTDALKKEILSKTDIALCAAAAGVQVLSLAQMAGSTTLKVVADVNAVPPTGAEGVDVFADGVAIPGTKAFGIGALAIGNVKYTTQHNLLKQMLETEEKLYLDFLSAFEMARKSL